MHGNRRSFLGLGLASAAAALALAAMPAQAARASPGNVYTIAGPATLEVRGVSAEVDGIYSLDHVSVERSAFVDGKVFPGCEQLRVFYRDQVYKPKGLAAMQPDNGAGQVSGDKALSVGKAGDLKAGRPGAVQGTTETPKAKVIDTGQRSELFRRTLPS